MDLPTNAAPGWGDPPTGMSMGPPTRWLSVPPPDRGATKGFSHSLSFNSEAACASALHACLQRGHIWDSSYPAHTLLPSGSPKLFHSLSRLSRTPCSPVPGSSLHMPGEPLP